MVGKIFDAGMNHISMISTQSATNAFLVTARSKPHFPLVIVAMLRPPILFNTASKSMSDIAAAQKKYGQQFSYIGPNVLREVIVYASSTGEVSTLKRLNDFGLLYADDVDAGLTAAASRAQVAPFVLLSSYRQSGRMQTSMTAEIHGGLQFAQTVRQGIVGNVNRRTPAPAYKL
jgi:hypothetical protein